MKSLTRIALAGCLGATLALGGCWRSQTLLLDPAQSARPLTDGVYVKVGGEPGEANAVVWKGGGWYELRDEGSISIFTLSPLGAIGGRQAFAAAMADDGCQSGEAENCEWDYAVLFIDGDRILVAEPDCRDTGALARRFGAAVTPDGDACKFAAGADVKAALAAYAAGPVKTERFVRR